MHNNIIWNSSSLELVGRRQQRRTNLIWLHALLSWKNIRRFRPIRPTVLLTRVLCAGYLGINSSCCNKEHYSCCHNALLWSRINLPTLSSLFQSPATQWFARCGRGNTVASLSVIRSHKSAHQGQSRVAAEWSSNCSIVITKKRNSLAPAKAHHVVFLMENL